MGNAKPYTDRQFQLSFMIIMSELLREKKKTVKKKRFLVAEKCTSL